jgi:thioredoxin reductase (NADPH)
MNTHDIIIIGSGIAGLTATKCALETKPSLKVANIEPESFGGLVMNVNELDGDIQGSGMELAAGLMMEITDLGAEIISTRVSALGETVNGWSVTTSEGRYRARAVIIASGASLKKLGVPGEAEFEYKGVSHCADCDGPFYIGKDVVVAGGGDSALQEARVLAQYCRRLFIINRASQFNAKPHLVAAITACTNVEVRHQTEVTAIFGGQTVEKVSLRTVANDFDHEIACSGFFGFIGLTPSSDFVPQPIARDLNGHVKTDSTLKVANGLFAAGAVRSGNGGMIEHAIADGRTAAVEAIKILT